jgi:hypothetical protein
MGPEAVVWAAVIVVFLIIVGVSAYQNRGGRRSSLSVGPAAAGTIYDFLNQDKRKAIELIVEEKAASRDPETADDVIEPQASGGAKSQADPDAKHSVASGRERAARVGTSRGPTRAE